MGCCSVVPNCCHSPAEIHSLSSPFFQLTCATFHPNGSDFRVPPCSEAQPEVPQSSVKEGVYLFLMLLNTLKMST